MGSIGWALFFIPGFWFVTLWVAFFWGRVVSRLPHSSSGEWSNTQRLVVFGFVAVLFCLIFLGFNGFFGKEHLKTSDLGAMGDLFGGMLNPILSFFILMYVIKEFKENRIQGGIAKQAEDRQRLLVDQDLKMRQIEPFASALGEIRKVVDEVNLSVERYFVMLRDEMFQKGNWKKDLLNAEVEATFRLRILARRLVSFEKRHREYLRVVHDHAYHVERKLRFLELLDLSRSRIFTYEGGFADYRELELKEDECIARFQEIEKLLSIWEDLLKMIVYDVGRPIASEVA